MKTKVLVVTLLLTISIFLYIPAEQNSIPKPRWKGSIQTEDGVRVLKNPIEPVYGKIKFKLKEDLCIGKKSDKNYTFNSVRDILVDDQEKIYVTDAGHFRVQIYDKNGQYIRTVGKHGKGPEEFQWFMALRIDDTTGNLYIQDGARQLKIFDKQGEYLSTVSLEKSVDVFDLEGNGNLIAVVEHSHALEKYSKALCKINAGGGIFMSFAEFPYEIHVQKSQPGDIFVVIETYDLLMKKIDDKRIIYGYSRSYELNVIDFQGNPIFKIKKDAIPRLFPKEQIQRDKKFNIKTPPYRPLFYSIFIDSKNRIYVQKNRIMADDIGAYKEVDIYSEDGHYLYEAVLPRGTHLIKNGFLYAYDIIQDKIIRYKIKNWEQIKTGILD